MADTITLRRLGPDDLELLVGVDDGLFDNAVRPDQTKAFLCDPLHEMIVAVADGKVVGMASGQVMLHPDKPPAFFVNEVGVRDAFQRRGIARSMCEELMRLVRTQGCEGVWLATEVDNKPARALYQSLNARETDGVVVYDWDDRALDR